MSEFDLIHDLNLPPRSKAARERADGDHDPGATAVSRAVAHGRPDTLGSRGALHLQRAAGNAAMGALVQRQQDDESPVHQVVGRGGGSALDTDVRSRMESTMGYDFSGVRVHTGPEAAGAARSVQAQAFTVGNDIVFNEGRYDPSSPGGQRTIAHELTHVVQQSQGEVPGESNGAGLKVSDPGDWAERQAEATADAVMAGGGGGTDHAGHDHGAGGPSVQALPMQREAGPDDDQVQTLPDLAAQRQDEEMPEEEELQALAEPTAQRQEEDLPEEEEVPA